MHAFRGTTVPFNTFIPIALQYYYLRVESKASSSSPRAQFRNAGPKLSGLIIWKEERLKPSSFYFSANLETSGLKLNGRIVWKDWRLWTAVFILFVHFSQFRNAGQKMNGRIVLKKHLFSQFNLSVLVVHSRPACDLDDLRETALVVRVFTNQWRCGVCRWAVRFRCFWQTACSRNKIWNKNDC